MTRFTLLLIAFLVFFCSSTAQQAFSPRSYVCYKATSPLDIDGKMVEESWKETQWTDDFVDIEGETRPAPRFHTRAKMLWDEKYFYVAAELEEPDVWGTLTERDAVIFHDNDFEVFIDPDGDTHQYYEFEMNALNAVWDLFLVKPYRDGGPAVNAWDIQGVKSGVHIQGTLNHPGDIDKGWTVEIAFPWEVLRECAADHALPKPGDQWRVNFSRVEWKAEAKDGAYRKVVNPNTGQPFPEDNWVWSLQGLINMHYPEMWGFVQFSDNTVGGGQDQFVFDVDEHAKWILRQVYYKEKAYFEKNRMFTESLEELSLTHLSVEGYGPPVIHTTSDLFQATVVRQDATVKWHIAQDGRTWKNH